ncbi:MAG TPA: type II toxin-antitoxin system RelE/ParE family toxin, partial [Pirellulales bacterium]|nr:type II toxin-antitoxin system RelE/ParE family toxin [Pirellulales bacterium]
DLIDIAVYIGADNPSAAEQFLNVLESKLQLLAGHPDLGQGRPELAIDLRSFVVRNMCVVLPADRRWHRTRQSSSCRSRS